MEVTDAGTANVRNLLLVATSVALRETCVDLGHGMERLMDVAEVVNNETYYERSNVIGVSEVLGNIVDVEGRFCCGSCLKVLGKVLEASYYINRWLSEVEVVDL